LPGLIWHTPVEGDADQDLHPKPTSPATPTITITAAHLTGDILPSGLRLDYDATLDQASGTTLVTLTLAATPASPLSGPAAGTPCAAPFTQEQRPRTITAMTDKPIGAPRHFRGPNRRARRVRRPPHR